MDSADAMQGAIRALGGKEWMQRKLEVSEARPRTDRPEGQFSNSGSGGGRW
ncbi:RNA-binding protein [Verrucomicrobium spinosum]|nr:RNA-binding protein [Verrucomicrobium spinosum]